MPRLNIAVSYYLPVTGVLPGKSFQTQLGVKYSHKIHFVDSLGQQYVGEYVTDAMVQDQFHPGAATTFIVSDAQQYHDIIVPIPDSIQTDEFALRPSHLQPVTGQCYSVALGLATNLMVAKFTAAGQKQSSPFPMPPAPGESSSIAISDDEVQSLVSAADTLNDWLMKKQLAQVMGRVL